MGNVAEDPSLPPIDGSETKLLIIPPPIIPPPFELAPMRCWASLSTYNCSG
ncbi:hypothetical protein ACFPRL_14095 [Pseudoclavibacter helvolus]